VERVSQLPAAERVARLAEEEERVAPQVAAKEPVSPQLAEVAPALRRLAVLQALALAQHPVHAAQAVIQVPAAALSCVRAVYEALPGRFVSAA
jgi:hypothetical protein